MKFQKLEVERRNNGEQFMKNKNEDNQWNQLNRIIFLRSETFCCCHFFDFFMR